MPQPHRTDEHDLVLPSGFDDIVRVIDRYVVDRRAGIPPGRQSARHRLPALLLTREAAADPIAEGGPGAGLAADDTGRGGPDPALSALVHVYHHRLLRLSTGETGHLASLAPHALVDEELLACDHPGEDAEGQDGPHVRLLDRVARQLRVTMPDGSGTLRLTEFDACLSVLRAAVVAGDVADERRALRDRIYDKYAWRFGFASEVTALGEELGAKQWSAITKLVTTPLAWLWRWSYGVRIDRGARLRWVGGMLDEPGRSFLNAAMSLRDAHVRSRAQDRADQGAPADAGAAAASARSAVSAVSARDEAVVRQVLLTALLHDLTRAARPPVWSVRRPRRRWPFVLLLPTVGGDDSPSRKLLNSFSAVSEDVGTCPLLVLGAATADIPPYAVGLPRAGVPSQGIRHGAHGTTAQTVASLLAAGASGQPVEAVRAVPLSRVPDNGTSAERPAVQRTVRARERRVGDWLRPAVAAVAVMAVVAAGLFQVLRPGGTHPRAEPVAGSRATDTWCPRVSTGERVGITDGSDTCELAHGLYAPELRALEARLGRQNADVDRTEPYRTLVFFAPLSVGSTSRRTVPTGFQMLRGALLAQKEVNALNLKSQMPIRLLVANAGEYFAFGSHGGLNTKNHSGVDVAHMIVDRIHRDHIAGVIGLTQSRPESLQAAIELDAQGVTVLGIGVSGQPMVEGDSPVSYFQLSAPDARVARIMATFARRSPRLAALTKAAPGHTAPAAVLVFDPHDTYFSADLKKRFTDAYGSAGPVYPVPYGESGNDSQTSSVAAGICALIRRTDGFVLYAGRSSVMYDLFYYLQSDKQCRTHQGRVAVLAESAAPNLVLHPELMAQQYGSLSLFYNQFSLPDAKGPFATNFRKTYGVSTDSDAAAGYDAVNVFFRVMNKISVTDPQFTPSAVVTFLQLTGVADYVGESGIMTIGKGHKYPVNKEVDIREITGDGTRITDLTCGAVAAEAAPVTRWGPSGNFLCPQDD
ncbi:hypothetical protein [Streptomyces rhizosphaerihabitans]|uniref:hypothetical protein n=1 Tax=Streptomyces rhizosphaerihabitans TaxID=1266770 RepID=UPI0021C0F53A|nr:hypothetical protein [Streptomyces rhizosphaerihabitans]MCT9007736.1 hypothetical protein [Streptomyces rhizosphaerihabitans]